jgi:hypothetical protein
MIFEVRSPSQQGRASGSQTGCGKVPVCLEEAGTLLDIRQVARSSESHEP